MNVQTTSVSRFSLGGLLRQAWSTNPLLTIAIVMNLLLTPLVLVAMWIDPVVITGVNGWIKPFKFVTSASIYAATFLWLLSYVQRGRRWTTLVGSLTGFALIVEIVLITVQVLRGATSHFNVATPLNAAIFSTMGGLITMLAVLNLVLAIWLVRQEMADPVFGWGLRWGVIISFVGMLVAFLMTAGPTPLQLAALRDGAALTTVGAHSVGVADGAPGLPFLGWSTVGGDLRVPHFFGLHGMQVLPLLGWLLTLGWARRRWSMRQRVALVWVAGWSYIALVVLLTWQALRAQPVIAPDGLMWVAYALLVGGAALAVALIDMRGSSTEQNSVDLQPSITR